MSTDLIDVVMGNDVVVDVGRALTDGELVGMVRGAAAVGWSSEADAKADIEFGGMTNDAVDVMVGFDWGEMIGGALKVVGKVWGPIKKLFKSKGKDKSAKQTLDDMKPGAGNAAVSAVQLILAATQGNPTALSQIKAVADNAKGGNADFKPAHDLLQVVNAARKQTATEAQVGKKRKKPTKAQLEAIRRKQQQARQRGRQPGQQPVTPQNVQQAFNRLPPSARPALANSIQRMQAQGYAPVQPYGAPMPYGMQDPYGMQIPYGMQPGQPFGYGMPPQYQQPYGPMYYDSGYAEQAGYYGGDEDAELAAAFAEDQSFPDEGIQGENTIAYQG